MQFVVVRTPKLLAQININNNNDNYYKYTLAYAHELVHLASISAGMHEYHGKCSSRAALLRSSVMDIMLAAVSWGHIVTRAYRFELKQKFSQQRLTIYLRCCCSDTFNLSIQASTSSGNNLKCVIGLQANCILYWQQRT